MLRQQPEEKRKKLSRAASSLARLQSDQNPSRCALSAYGIKDPKDTTSNKTEEDVEFYFGDSDKENWIPGTQMSYSRRRDSSRRRTRATLKASHNPGQDATSTWSAVLNSKLARSSQRQPAAATKENRKHVPKGEDDEEVSPWSSGPGVDEDLDCIQGLLSLSQGAWR